MTRRALVARASRCWRCSLLAPAGASGARAARRHGAPARRDARRGAAPGGAALQRARRGRTSARVRVFDADARRVDDGRTVAPGGDGTRLGVGLRPGLPDGTYVATYRVVSADTHPISGGFVFSVGAAGAARRARPSPTSSATRRPGRSPRSPSALARGLTYVATALAARRPARSCSLVWRPRWRRRRRRRSGGGAARASRRARARCCSAAPRSASLAGSPGSSCRAPPPARTSVWAALDAERRARRARHALRRGVGGCACCVRALGARSAAAWSRSRRPRAGGARDAGVPLPSRRSRSPRPPRSSPSRRRSPATPASQSPVALLVPARRRPRGRDVRLDRRARRRCSFALPAATRALDAAPTARACSPRRCCASRRSRWPASSSLVVTGTIQSILHVDALGRAAATPPSAARCSSRSGCSSLLIALGAVNRRRVAARACARSPTAARRPATPAACCAARCAPRSRSCSSCSA